MHGCIHNYCGLYRTLYFTATMWLNELTACISSVCRHILIEMLRDSVYFVLFSVILTLDVTHLQPTIYIRKIHGQQNTQFSLSLDEAY